MNRFKLILPISILMGSIILGAAYYVSQINSVTLQCPVVTTSENKEFAEKERCSSFISKIDDDYNKWNRESFSDISQNQTMEIHKLEEVAYSKKLNTCIAVTSGIYTNYKLGGKEIKSFYVKDLLTNKILLERQINEDYIEESFKNELNSLR